MSPGHPGPGEGKREEGKFFCFCLKVVSESGWSGKRLLRGEAFFGDRDILERRNFNAKLRRSGVIFSYVFFLL